MFVKHNIQLGSVEQTTANTTTWPRGLSRRADMSAGSPDNNGNTVDELVDSLVQEIDNELIHTLEEVEEGDSRGKEGRYQLPLQDIGEETLDMIVNYNTRANSDVQVLATEGQTDLQVWSDEGQSDDDSSVVINRVLPSLEEDTTHISDTDTNITDVEYSPLIKLDDPNIDKQVDEVAQTVERIQKQNDSFHSNKSLQDSNGEELYGIGIIDLPPLPEKTPMFRNSSLAQILDTSLENDVSTSDIREKNIPPKDFLSVWHMQDTTTSPALSHNSQFTKYTNSTMTSSPPSTTSPRNSAIFNFKPRVVSQSKIYYPRSNASSRVTSGIYSMVTTESIKQELEDNNRHMFVPHHEYELANTINLQDEKNISNDLIHVNLNDDEEEGDELGFSFDDLFNKLDNLGNDTLESQDSVIPDKPMETLLPVLSRETTPEAPAHIEARHVASPFKIKNSNKVDEKEEVIERQQSIVSIQDEEEIEDEAEVGEEDSDEEEILKDSGVFYINVLNLQGFKIEGYKHRNAKFYLEFKQGGKVIHTTPYTPVSNDSTIKISKEFSFIINDEFKSFGNNKLTINLKVQYDKISKQTVEVVKKVAVKKRFPFGKTRYVYQKSFVDKPVELDSWSNIIDIQGRFGSCEVDMSDSMLQKVEFHNAKHKLTLMNKIPNSLSHAGALNVEMLYIPRKNNDECIPSQMSKVSKIVSKHLYQMSLHNDGYMLQEGGDVMEGTMQRRYFRLDGTTLLACHEMTHNPLISINLLNLKHISSSFQNGERNFTDFTDIVLYGDHIKLQFFDGETITLTTDTNGGDSLDEWNHVLQEVVSLNVSHQPWVQSMCNGI